MIANLIKDLIKEAGTGLGIQIDSVHLEHPDNLQNGDYSSNIALAHAKVLGKNPKEVAGEFKDQILKIVNEKGISDIEKIEVAGPGFLNFHLSREFFKKSIGEIIEDDNFGKGNSLKGKTALFEYTDPNPFKAFHIGHLMANAVGETLSRLAGNQSADVKRICYQGDIGLHVAKTVWAMKQMNENLPKDNDSFEEKIKFMGDAYVLGTNTYDENEVAQTEIKEINKKLFEKSDNHLQELYDKGKEWSLIYFDSIYKKLGTKFNDFIFESEVSDLGKSIVEKNIPNIFTESDGAVVFKGEDHGLHTRVFLNSQRLPTYEAKELANAIEKSKRYKFDISIITSANEISDYFRVIKCVMGLIDKENAEKTHFVPHGMLRFAEGKMSSRKGNIITGESLINDIKEISLQKMEKDFEDKEEIAEAVAISAIKYSILKQSPGKDIIFDKEKALSFEGDSGPYLEYAFVRTGSLLEKAKSAGITPDTLNASSEPFEIEKFLYRFPEVALRAWEEKAPQLVIEYLTRIASEFNRFYANGLIVSNEADSPYKVAITKVVNTVMKRGLELLGIPVLKKM